MTIWFLVRYIFQLLNSFREYYLLHCIYRVFQALVKVILLTVHYSSGCYPECD